MAFLQSQVSTARKLNELIDIVTPASPTIYGLPSAGLTLGTKIILMNRGTAVLTIQSSNGNTIGTISPNQDAILIVNTQNPTSSSDWKMFGLAGNKFTNPSGADNYSSATPPGSLISNFTINGLTVDVRYRMNWTVGFRADSSGYGNSTLHCIAHNNSVEIGRLSWRFSEVGSADTDFYQGGTHYFTATATSLLFYAFNPSGTPTRIRFGQITVEPW